MKNKWIIVLFLLGISAILHAGDIKISPSEWEGYLRHDFVLNERNVTVVFPKTAAPNRAWIWRPAFFGAFPSVDKALLAEGFHVVYCDMTHRYGSPKAVEEGRAFYDYMLANYRLSPQVTLEGFSRGGYYVLNWAIANPEKVACIYLDNPVCDMFSWPGKNSPQWKAFLREWELTAVDKATFRGNPIDNLAPLAKRHIPIMAVCGDSDRTVPFQENIALVRENYQKMGAPIELIIKPGADHHPHSLENPEAVVDFICRNQPSFQQKQHLYPRGSVNNSYLRFEKERKGRVAFLGGSITEMQGWRDMTKQYLKQRFPYTSFDFVEVGIPSTGTTPHAFRLENDVLSRGDIDLIFVEAAVNDCTNGFNAIEQVRGMEGIVRHLLTANALTDIVMLHFIYDPFLEMYPMGRTPDVILNHERVANHYLTPSVDLAHEVSERITCGEFDWKKFGGVHPSWFGHKYYAASLIHLLDNMWAKVPANPTLKAHQIPTQPLDQSSYFKASFVDISEAKLSKGWKHLPSWNPNNEVSTRKGFVNVPTLYSNSAKSQFSFSFVGRAVGLFCICGPSAGIIEYSIDGGAYKKIDTYTQWSNQLYLPWAYLLETELDPNKTHTLTARVSVDKNPKSKGYECIIRNILVNQ